MSEYDTVEETLDYLRQHEVGTEEYREATGYLYSFLEEDVRMNQQEAIHAVRHLNKGQVEDAEELVEDVLG